ncbi:nuclear transition protein 2 [Suricata suricatta]|uniref:Nuclear transition protein 2 n=1 Tax=Suricata suricatta TaxID=37032 RepID=A0A673VFI7_SURSU|nr:nuclear transition protein 2 [Suricata suricatta]
MDTKTQSLPIAHTQPHSNSRPQRHPCNQCHCSLHCHTCSHTCGHTCSRSRSRASNHSPTGPQSQSPNPSLPLRHQKHSMHSHCCPPRPTPHSRSYPKNRKNLGRKVTKRKVVKRSQQVYKTKRSNTARKYN